MSDDGCGSQAPKAAYPHMKGVHERQEAARIDCRRVGGLDSLALDMSIGAAAEQASVQGMASMALGDEGALDALLYPLVAGAQRRSALRSPLPRVALPTLCLSLLLTMRARCRADRTAAAPRHGES